MHINLGAPVEDPRPHVVAIGPAQDPEPTMRPTRLLTALLVASCAKAPASGVDDPLLAPTTDEPPPGVFRLQIADAGLPESAEDGLHVRWSPAWRFQDKEGPVRLALRLDEGQDIGGSPFGIVRTADGTTPFADPDGQTPWLAGALDHSSVFKHPDGWRMWSHVENQPSSLYLTDLSRTDHGFEATATRAVDLTGIGGGKDFCAGTITPWGSLLSSEEYDQDWRRLGDDGLVSEPRSSYDHTWNRLPDALPDPSAFSPYATGWIPEFTLHEDGSVTAVKHLAMGRFSHEIGLVMPDRRTVLLTDDQSRHGGLFLYVADLPEDLSAGTLYAMKWTQSARAKGGAAQLAWVSLGRAQPETLTQAWSMRLDDVMVAVDPLADDTCPATPGGPVIRRVTTAFGTECVGPVPGRETLASRLETRRYAAWAGATTEFTKAEGATYDPVRQRILVAVSRITEGMTDGEGHVDVDPNPCGGIYALGGLAHRPKDTTGHVIDSAFVPTTMHAELVGVPQPDGTCSQDGIAEPDNITILPSHDLLVIAEDTKPRRHAVPTLWAYDLHTRRLARLATGPRCAEWSGLHGTLDSARVWLNVSLQHAYEDGSCRLPEGQAIPEGEPRTWTGILGPFPRGPVVPTGGVKRAMDAEIGGRVQ